MSRSTTSRSARMALSPAGTSSMIKRTTFTSVPDDKVLTTTGTRGQRWRSLQCCTGPAMRRLFRACPLKAAMLSQKRLNNARSRVPIHERAKDMARAIAETDAGEASRKDRKKVEMLFAHLKRILKLGRLRLRGPCGASDEFLLRRYCPEPQKTRQAQNETRTKCCFGVTTKEK